MNYARVLNNRPKYRQALLDALVHDQEFPDFPGLDKARIGAMSPSRGSLMDLLLRRDFNDVEAIMNLQYERFGTVNTELFWSVIAYVGHHAAELPASLETLVKQSKTHPTHVPAESTFVGWREYHRTYFADVINYVRSIVPAGIQVYSNEQLQGVFNDVLEWTGLASDGWQAGRDSHANFVSVDKPNKRLYIGPAQVRLSRQRLIGLLLHEIYIHAMWSQHYHSRDTSSREEGIGTLVEQLTIRRYHPLRTYRFLAICFALGIDGTPRSMREVYRLLCEIRQALNPTESPESRKLFVAKETVRVYRNLPPTIKGLVYIRDKNYLEHNEQIWDTLSSSEPSLEFYTNLVAPWKEKS